MENREKINGKLYFTAKSLMKDLNIGKTKAHNLIKGIEKETPFAIATINKTVKTKNGQKRKVPTKVINPNYYETIIYSDDQNANQEIEKEIKQLKYATKKDLLTEIKKRDYHIAGLEEQIAYLKSQISKPKNPFKIKKIAKTCDP